MAGAVRTRTWPAAAPAWQVDEAARELILDGRRTRLAEKPFRVLMALMERPGEVVSREHLRQRLWPDDTFVDFDNNLNTAVATLRHALGDSARAPRFIETLPRLGYRLLPAAGLADGRPATPARFSIGLVAASAAAVLLLLSTSFVLWPRDAAAPSRTAAPAPTPAAADAFARGSYLRQQFTVDSDPERLREARRAFQEALSIDPGFAPALAEDAETVVEMAFAGTVGFRAAMQEARTLAGRALALDARAAAAHRVMAMTLLFLDWDVAGAAASLGRAETLDGSVARTAMARATVQSVLGRHDEAVAAARRAVALEPASYFVRADLAFFYLAAGRNEDAATSSQAVLAVRPDFAPALLYAATAYERLERWTDAAAAARALMAASGATPEQLAAFDAMTPHAAVRRWRQWDLARTEARASGRAGEFAFELALKYAAAGQLGAALDSLEDAHARRAALLVYVRAFPELSVLHGHPRFERLADAIAPASSTAG